METNELTNMSLQPNLSELHTFIERLKPLEVILSQNSYVRDVTKRLHRMIEDTENAQLLLIVGKERVGKTSLINALLGRQLLIVHTAFPTSANTFIRYGEEECIKAIFLDGMIATFDLGKLELLTSSDNFGAQIIREHLDYLEVYVKHDLLRDVTIVDTTALEIGANNTAFFSPALVSRVDHIFFVVRNGSPALEAEVNYLKKLAAREMKPHLIINAIDGDERGAAFTEDEQARYGEFIESTLGVSAQIAMEARKTNDMQLLIDSRYTELTQLIKTIVSDNTKKTRHMTERFIHWLERLRKEIELIPQREPYISAYDSVKREFDDSNYEFSRQQRDLAIISAYEDEYKQVSEVFKPVQTLYQLLQVLASDLYLRDETVERFEQHAIRYQESVRDYRRTHSDYIRQYESFSKQYKKRYGQELTTQIAHNTDQFILDRVMMVNDLQQKLAANMVKIQEQEVHVVRELYGIQNHLNDLAMERLRAILGQVGELNIQRKKERLNLKSYVNKLAEFTCITEAQGFLRDAILPYILGEHLPLTAEEKQHVQNTIECICAIDLTHEAVYNRASRSDQIQTSEFLEFDANYSLIGLSLTEADVVSDLPTLPQIIVFA
ncbi:MAG: dynamin family protein [Solibacillus sp.]